MGGGGGGSFEGGEISFAINLLASTSTVELQ